jgi:hypothetical protein
MPTTNYTLLRPWHWRRRRAMLARLGVEKETSRTLVWFSLGCAAGAFLGGGMMLLTVVGVP